MEDTHKPRIAYFGGEPLGVPVLEILTEHGIVPDLIVTNPDRPSGRGKQLTAPPVKEWAAAHDVPTMQPVTLRDPAVAAELESNGPWDLFVVVAYSAIIPPAILNIPTHKTLNMHPSLLPAFRGPSPIRSAILGNARTTGVTIMLMDEQLDHGPILAQRSVTIDTADWPMRGQALDTLLAHAGGKLLAATVPKWLAGSITPLPQNHEQATYTKKFTKADGQLSIDPENLPSGDEATQLLLKIRAFDGWPGTHFFHNGTRIKVVDGMLDEHGTLCITRIIPEGKQEVDFDQYFSN